MTLSRRRTGTLAKYLRAVTLSVVAGAVSGCDLAPLYQAPRPILPATYHGTGPFVTATPEDQLPRGPWWQVFDDPELDSLEKQLDSNNPDLQSAREAYTQSRDIVAEARAGLYPQLSGDAGVSENKQSDHRLFRVGETGANTQAANQIGVSASWEPDFWRSIRNQTKSAKAIAQASAASLASAQLSLEAELATDYVTLRGLDAQHAVYTQAIASYQTAVSITQLRLSGQIASAIDVGRAQNQLAAALALDTEIVSQREVMVHAIAVLAGVTPGTLDLPPPPAGTLLASVPLIPAGVPSALLQRRPDIAEAERDMAAANARIGVARAAFYPDINLSAISGFQDTGFNLASLPNSLWAVGASAVLPLFEGGLRKAELQQNWSRLAQATDQYRATVLRAFQQVEDGLVLQARLATEATQQATAEHAARGVQARSLTLYTGGLSDYINVTVAQIAELTAEIAVVEVHTRRQAATIRLVLGLGGGWNNQDLPSMDQTLPFDPLVPWKQPGDVAVVHRAG